MRTAMRSLNRKAIEMRTPVAHRLYGMTRRLPNLSISSVSDTLLCFPDKLQRHQVRKQPAQQSTSDYVGLIEGVPYFNMAL